MGARRVALYCALMALSRWKIVRSLALSLISQKITKSTSSLFRRHFASFAVDFSCHHTRSQLDHAMFSVLSSQFSVLSSQFSVLSSQSSLGFQSAQFLMLSRVEPVSWRDSRNHSLTTPSISRLRKTAEYQFAHNFAGF